MATRKPATYHCAATRWSLADWVAALGQRRTGPMSRSRLWRLLDEADLQPPRSVSWLNRHDPDGEATAHDRCALSLNAHRFFAQGRVVIGTDAKTGRQMRPRPYPPQPLAPGKPEQREQEDIRHGVRALIASFVVPTGHVVWNLGQTRSSHDVAAHRANVVHQRPARPRDDWVVEHLHTPWSLAVCRLVAPGCPVPFVAKDLGRGVQRRAFLRAPTHQHGFHCTPKHGAWLHHVEWWLSLLARRFLKRGDDDAAHDFDTRLYDYLEVSNTHHAHPYRWT